MNEYIIKQEDEGERLDKVLLQVIENASRQNIQTWIKAENVLVNGLGVKPNYKCHVDDVVKWEIERKTITRTILPEEIALEVIFEDDDLIIVNKPRGMIVHPTPQTTSGTLVNALLNYSDRLSDLSGEERPGIVHRLDQDTSGLLVIAKNNSTHQALKVQFQNHTVQRIYHAITIGNVPHAHGVIKAPIGRNPKIRTQMAVVEDGKESETRFTVLEQFKGYSLLACELKTGRTHQIRVHLKYMGYPILGDKVYVRKKTHWVEGQALYAKKLSFVHPSRQEEMTFEIDPPEDFQSILKKLSN